MKALCPICRTEMLERSNIHVCPRNDIGDCSYDALSLLLDDDNRFLEQTGALGDLRSYVVPDPK